MVKNEVWGIPGPEERTCVGEKSRFPRTRRHVARWQDAGVRYQPEIQAVVVRNWECRHRLVLEGFSVVDTSSSNLRPPTKT